MGLSRLHEEEAQGCPLQAQVRDCLPCRLRRRPLGRLVSRYKLSTDCVVITRNVRWSSKYFTLTAPPPTREKALVSSGKSASDDKFMKRNAWTLTVTTKSGRLLTALTYKQNLLTKVVEERVRTWCWASSCVMDLITRKPSRLHRLMCVRQPADNDELILIVSRST